MRHPALIPLLLIALTSCASPPSLTESNPSSSNPAPHSLPSEDMYEALFRYQFTQMRDEKPLPPNALFLAIDGQDPPPDFLQRFASSTPPVLPRSQFQKRAGIVHYAHQPKFITNTLIEIDAGWSNHEQGGQGYTYRLHQEQGRWTVKSATLYSIS